MPDKTGLPRQIIFGCFVSEPVKLSACSPVTFLGQTYLARKTRFVSVNMSGPAERDELKNKPQSSIICGCSCLVSNAAGQSSSSRVDVRPINAINLT